MTNKQPQLLLILNDDGTVTIEPSSEYFELDYEEAVGFITEAQSAIEDLSLNLDYENLLL